MLVDFLEFCKLKIFSVDVVFFLILVFFLFSLIEILFVRGNEFNNLILFVCWWRLIMLLLCVIFGFVELEY